MVCWRITAKRLASFAVTQLLVLFTVALIWVAGAPKVRAADEAQAAVGPPLHIALFVNSSTVQCYSDGRKLAVERLSRLAADEINNRGGVRGRPIELAIFDNAKSTPKAIANAKAALNLDNLIAMVGLQDPERAGAVFAALAKEPGAAKIPFISNISVGRALAAHSQVYSTRPAQEVERVPAMVAFFKANNIKTIAFLGRTGARYAEVIGDGLKSAMGEQVIADHRINVEGSGERAQLDEAALARAISDLESNPPDMVVVSVGTRLTDDVLKRLKASRVQPPVFMVGWLSGDLFDARSPYPAPVYGIDWASVPESRNDRVFRVLGRGDPNSWLFAGRETASAETWAANNCKKYYRNYVPGTFTGANIAAARHGAVFADMVKLIATSAGKTGSSLDTGATRSGATTPIETYRAAVLADLGRIYASGRGTFKGLFENWAFHADKRVRAQTPMIVILPHTLGRKQLAPTQFVRLRDGNLKAIDTLYMDVDLIRTYAVDNNAKSFFAEFYVAMRVSENLSIEDVTFTNAFLDPRASRDPLINGREISIDVLHPGGASDAYPADMRVYRVAGRFRFTPDFSQYPFDSQQFSIDIQPKSGDKTFIVQPPPPQLRDKVATSEGWIPDRQYVSFVEDFVPIVDAFTHTPSVVPFYKSRYVWQMKREATDYYIRVIVPLAFILIVAYLSIFIPKTHLEAIVTIQVTALLAAVALYLSLPQIDTDTATISDRIFMFDYMMVSIMIIVSILRINARVIAHPWLDKMLNFIHIVLMPVVLLGLVLYMGQAELISGFDKLPGWHLLGFD